MFGWFKTSDHYERKYSRLFIENKDTDLFTKLNTIVPFNVQKRWGDKADSKEYRDLDIAIRNTPSQNVFKYYQNLYEKSEVYARPKIAWWKPRWTSEGKRRLGLANFIQKAVVTDFERNKKDIIKKLAGFYKEAKELLGNMDIEKLKSLANRVLEDALEPAIYRGLIAGFNQYYTTKETIDGLTGNDENATNMCNRLIDILGYYMKLITATGLGWNKQKSQLVANTNTDILENLNSKPFMISDYDK